MNDTAACADDFACAPLHFSLVTRLLFWLHHLVTVMNYRTFVVYCQIDLQKGYQLTMPQEKYKYCLIALLDLRVFFFLSDIYFLAYVNCQFLVIGPGASWY